MQRLPAVAALLTGASCVNLPHVPPRPRTENIREVAAVEVTSNCSWEDPFATDPDTGRNYTTETELHVGSGVIISERHVLTAAHVVGCPWDIPVVHVRLIDGRTMRMVVEREDVDLDVARLVIASADRFGFGIAPPTLVEPGYDSTLCTFPAFPSRRESCGPIVGRHRVRMYTRTGYSGAADYDVPGDLVGIHVRGNGTTAEYAPVDASWLEGT